MHIVNVFLWYFLGLEDGVVGGGVHDRKATYKPSPLTRRCALAWSFYPKITITDPLRIYKESRDHYPAIYLEHMGNILLSCLQLTLVTLLHI